MTACTSVGELRAELAVLGRDVIEQPPEGRVGTVERELLQHLVALGLERAVDGAGERGDEAVALLGREQLEEGALLADVLRERLREHRALAVEVLREHRLELAVALREPLEPLGKRAGLRVEVDGEEVGHAVGDLAGAIDEELAHGAEQAIALTLQRLRVERAARLAEGEDTEAQGLAGVLLALASRGAPGELVGDLGIGDEELDPDGRGVFVGGDGGEGRGVHSALASFLSAAIGLLGVEGAPSRSRNGRGGYARLRGCSPARGS